MGRAEEECLAEKAARLGPAGSRHPERMPTVSNVLNSYIHLTAGRSLGKNLSGKAA